MNLQSSIARGVLSAPRAQDRGKDACDGRCRGPAPGRLP